MNEVLKSTQFMVTTNFTNLSIRLACTSKCAAREHVHRIERGVRTLKERVRCSWVLLPYRKAPKIMVDENLIDMVSCLNDFPHKEGISRTLSPAMIVLGRNKPNCQRLKVTFGA